MDRAAPAGYVARTLDRSDIDAAFRKFGPLIYRRARYILGAHEEAEEATQEVFLRALRNAAAFEHRSQIYTWLVRITTNHCLNVLRNQRRRRELMEINMPDTSRQQQQSPGALPVEEMLMMRRLLAQADEGCAMAAIYVFVDGMSHQEAASVLGVSRRTVGNQLTRFKQGALVYLESSQKRSEPVDSG